MSVFSAAEARAWQQRQASQVIEQDQLPAGLSCIGGADVGFERHGQVTRAVICVLGFPDLQLLDYAIARIPTRIPYIPGLLSFRECPAMLAALEQLRVKPQLLLVDGQGRAHPRRFGVACHLGLESGIPAIGVAKSRLVGRHEPLPDPQGSQVPLLDGDERIGTVVRSRTGVRPLFVSVGHRISLESAVGWVLRCLRGRRLPEPIRWADGIASTRPALMKALRESACYRPSE